MSEMPATDKVIEQSVSSAKEYVRAAWTHQANREFGQAAETFRKALELDAGFVDGQYGLAMALKFLDRPEQAIEAFERVISLLKESEPEDRVRADMLVRLAEAQIRHLRSAASPS